MRTHLTVALSMLTGIAVGAVAVQGLHAQSKPMVYLVNEIDVTDPEKYGAEFTPKAQASVRNSGAKFLVIGGAAGAGAKPIHAIEGTPKDPRAKWISRRLRQAEALRRHLVGELEGVRSESTPLVIALSMASVAAPFAEASLYFAAAATGGLGMKSATSSTRPIA